MGARHNKGGLAERSGAAASLGERLHTDLLAEHGKGECQISYSPDIYSN